MANALGSGCIGGLLLAPSAGRGDVPADNRWTDTERWAWSQIAAGQTADFDVPCRASPATADDSAWNDPCRTVRGFVLEQMLTRTPWRDAIQHRGLWLIGARVTGDLDLANAHFAPAMLLTRSRIEGDVLLARARFDSFLAFDGSLITGAINGAGMASESDVSLSDGRQLGPQDPSAGIVEAQKSVTFRNARIKGSLLLNRGHFEQMVDLRGAHVDEDVQTSGADFKAALWAGSMQIGGKLSINATRFGGDALFPNSTIGGLVDASESTFAQQLNLVDGHVAGDVFINNPNYGYASRRWLVSEMEGLPGLKA